MVLAQGGPVTQVEQEEMPRILTEAKSDALKKHVTMKTRMEVMDYTDFLEEYE